MTPEEAANALLADPETCPYCGGDQLEGEHVDIQVKYAVQEVACADCDARFYMNFKLCSVQVIVDDAADAEDDIDEEEDN